MELRTEGLTKIYSGRTVVNDLSISVSKGSVVGLLGPNGAGKTTTFYMIVGMISPAKGDIYLNDEKITGLPMYQRARRGLGYLPQETSIFRKLTVEQNLYAILEMTEPDRKKRKDKAEYLLGKLRIDHIRNNVAGNLSGGERRRAEIARALTSEPAFLLLDEPFTGIDPKVRADIQNIVRDLASDGIGIIITDHNVRETLEIIDTAHIIYEGNILISGSASELIEDKKARELYLGDKFRL